MLKLTELKTPASLEEAYELLRLPHHTALAGGTLFQLQAGEPTVGVELTHLLPNGIAEEGCQLRIGAMMALRTLETSPALQTGSLSILPASVRHLQGPALRNLITVGGTVGARFPQSEFLTALLALDAQVVLYRGGTVPLETFLNAPPEDIICANGADNLITAMMKAFINEGERVILVDREPGQTGFCAVRNSYVDQPVLCAAACLRKGLWRIAVGARPFLAEGRTYPSDRNIREIAADCGAAFRMGDDLKAAADYRRRICPVIVRRAMEGACVCR